MGNSNTKAPKLTNNRVIFDLSSFKHEIYALNCLSCQNDKSQQIFRIIAACDCPYPKKGYVFDITQSELHNKSQKIKTKTKKPKHNINCHDIRSFCLSPTGQYLAFTTSPGPIVTINSFNKPNPYTGIEIKSGLSPNGEIYLQNGTVLSMTWIDDNTLIFVNSKDAKCYVSKLNHSALSYSVKNITPKITVSKAELYRIDSFKYREQSYVLFYCKHNHSHNYGGYIYILTYPGFDEGGMILRLDKNIHFECMKANNDGSALAMVTLGGDVYVYKRIETNDEIYNIEIGFKYELIQKLNVGELFPYTLFIRSVGKRCWINESTFCVVNTHSVVSALELKALTQDNFIVIFKQLIQIFEGFEGQFGDFIANNVLSYLPKTFHVWSVESHRWDIYIDGKIECIAGCNGAVIPNGVLVAATKKGKIKLVTYN